MSASLPASPSLEHLRKAAKDLLRAHRAGDEAARSRVAAHHPRPAEPLKLSGAQLVIAREHGFPSWPRLRAYVDRLAAHGPDLQHAYHEELDYYDDRAYGLLASAQDGTDGALAAFGRHDAPLTREGARVVIAREHGFPVMAGVAPSRRRPARDRRAVRARLSRDRGARRRAAGGAARPFPRARDRARDERQRPARDGRRDLRRAPGGDPARARRRRHARQRARLDTAAPGRLQRPARAGADAARRGRAGRRLGARRRRHAARRRAVLGQPRDRRAARRARRPAAQPARRFRARATRPAGRADRRPREPRARGGSAPRLLPPPQRLPGLAAVRGRARGPRRGADAGRRATTASRRSSGSSSAAPRSRPTSTAAPH